MANRVGLRPLPEKATNEQLNQYVRELAELIVRMSKETNVGGNGPDYSSDITSLQQKDENLETRVRRLEVTIYGG